MEDISVYGCGTPIRMHVCRAFATYLKCKLYEEGNPVYRGDNAIVWGLIRGSPKLIEEVKQKGKDYYQLDNGYFGRNAYYRFTKNAFQQTELKIRKPDRWEHIKKTQNLTLNPWKKDGKHVLFCLSTEHLYKFHGMEIEKYRMKTLRRVKEVTQRPVIVREKDAVGPIEDALRDAWCVLTHTSAVALDALRFGIPVFTTGLNAADPCALKDVTLIDTPIYPEREPLFWSLSYSQWLPEEFQLGRAWEDLHRGD